MRQFRLREQKIFEEVSLEASPLERASMRWHDQTPADYSDLRENFYPPEKKKPT